MKIGFIGTGNMAGSMIKGFLKAGLDGKQIIVHSAHKERYEKFAQDNGVMTAPDNLTLAKNSDLIVMAVEPHIYEKIISEISPALNKEKTVASVLVGITIAQLTTAINDPEVSVVRLMPNINVKINEGMIAIQGNDASKPKLPQIEQLFEKLGSVMEIPEAKFSIFAALAGSAPAFVYLFIDSLARAGVKYGLSKSQADQIASQVVLGSARTVLETKEAPFKLIDQVSSPGGTTIAGLLAMEEHGLITSVIKGIDATMARDQEKK